VAELHHASHQPLGVFHAVRYLRDDGALTAAELAVADEVFAWMHAHLESPAEATLAAHPDAISWFRVTATEALERAERVAVILEAHGQNVTRRETSDPGAVVYEDGLQILAVKEPR
jgi:hypothetical protein